MRSKPAPVTITTPSYSTYYYPYTVASPVTLQPSPQFGATPLSPTSSSAAPTPGTSNSFAATATSVAPTSPLSFRPSPAMGGLFSPACPEDQVALARAHAEAVAATAARSPDLASPPRAACRWASTAAAADVAAAALPDSLGRRRSSHYHSGNDSASMEVTAASLAALRRPSIADQLKQARAEAAADGWYPGDSSGAMGMGRQYGEGHSDGRGSL